MRIFGYKDSKANYKERKGVYGIVFNKHNEVAVIEMPHGDFLPGGGEYDYESDEGCLKREFIEETGYNIIIKSLVCKAIEYTYAQNINKHIKLIASFYMVDLLDDTGLKSEIDHKFVWKKREDIEKSMHLECQHWAIIEAYKIKST